MGGSGADGTARSGGPESGDAANLDYARKATDLVLNRLKDQQDNPDPELLKKLNWSQDELKEFIGRWEAMKQAAEESERSESRQLDQALRSLGLRRDNVDRRAVQRGDDQVRGMRDAGARTKPPAEFFEQFNAYRRGIQRARGTDKPNK